MTVRSSIELKAQWRFKRWLIILEEVASFSDYYLNLNKYSLTMTNNRYNARKKTAFITCILHSLVPCGKTVDHRQRFLEALAVECRRVV